MPPLLIPHKGKFVDHTLMITDHTHPPLWPGALARGVNVIKPHKGLVNDTLKRCLHSYIHDLKLFF